MFGGSAVNVACAAGHVEELRLAAAAAAAVRGTSGGDGVVGATPGAEQGAPVVDAAAGGGPVPEHPSAPSADRAPLTAPGSDSATAGVQRRVEAASPLLLLVEELEAAEADDHGGWGRMGTAVRVAVQRWVRRLGAAAASAAATVPVAPVAPVAPVPVAAVHARDMTPGRFARDFASVSRPVLVRHACSSSRWAAREQWRRDTLVRVAGAAPVSVGSIPYAALYGEATVKGTLRSFAQEHMGGGGGGAAVSLARMCSAAGIGTQPKHSVGRDAEPPRASDASAATSGRTAVAPPPPPPYVFDPQLLRRHAALADGVGSLLVALDTLFNATASSSTLQQMIVGPALSGSPLHFHGPAFNALVRSQPCVAVCPCVSPLVAA